MAKPTTAKIRLNSEGKTGFFYVAKKNTRTMTEKFSIKKYDPVLRKPCRIQGRQDQVSVPLTAVFHATANASRTAFAAAATASCACGSTVCR